MDAEEASIRHAFRLLARRFHPDAGAGSSAEEFYRIIEAYRSPILRGRFHDHFLNLLGDQPVRQSAQFTWTGSHFPPLKLVLALHGYVRDNHGQHSLVHIDPGNSVCHLRLLPETERMPKMKL